MVNFFNAITGMAKGLSTMATDMPRAVSDGVPALAPLLPSKIMPEFSSSSAGRIRIG
jgi:hypothetical protein